MPTKPLTHMKHSIILFLITLFTTASLAQTDSGVDTSKVGQTIETMPEFPGGTDGLFKVMREHLKYPESARKDNVSGKVFVGFVIDTLGNVTDVKIVRGVRDDLDNEAMRVVKLLNGWTPGTQNGKKVKVAYSLPINFSLPAAKGRKGK
jgi:periplasmic protein TonB